MNIWHDIDSKRITPTKFVACIEISKNSKMKYELDKETGRLILDRVLFTSTHYPANYGFIPKTYAGDNDPLDVLVLCQSEIIPLDKLISKLKRELKISATNASKTDATKMSTYRGDIDIKPETVRKNKQKASILYYLEQLKTLTTKEN